MKNDITHSYEEAKIYRDYYRPSFNFLRLFKSVLAVILTGSSPAANTLGRERKHLH